MSRRGAAVAVAAAVAVVLGLGACGAPPAASSRRTSSTAAPTSPSKTASPCGTGPAAPGNCLVAVSFVNDDDGFGVYGAQTATALSQLQLVETEDGGARWSVVAPVPAGATGTTFPQHLVFVDRETGFLYGSSRLFVTHDGGHAWSAGDVPERVVDVTLSPGRTWATYSSCPMFDATMVPCRVGIDVSADGGRSWRPVVVPAASYETAQLAFGSSRTMVLGAWRAAVGAGAGELLVSGDGGAAWVTHVLPCPVGYRLGGQLSVAQGSGTIWMVCQGQGSGGNVGLVIYRSLDEGTTWLAESSYALGGPTGVRPGAPWGTLEQLVALSSTKAFALTINGGLFESTDGGKTWQQPSDWALDNRIAGLSTIDVLDPTHTWIAVWETVPGQRGLWRTTDGGERWQPV